MSEDNEFKSPMSYHSDDLLLKEEERDVDRFEELLKRLDHKIQESVQERKQLNMEWSTWKISQREFKRYAQLFQHFDLPPKLPLLKEKAETIFLETTKHLTKQDFDRIWDLADLDKDGGLTVEEFSILMFLLEKQLQGVPMPEMLPKNLLRQSMIGSPTSSPHLQPLTPGKYSWEGLSHPTSPTLESSATASPRMERIYFKPKPIQAFSKLNKLPNLAIQNAMRKCEEIQDSKIEITIYQYSESDLEFLEPKTYDEITALPPSWVRVRWINFEGFNKRMLTVLGKKFKLHKLALEDVQDIPQRAKVEYYPNHLLLTMQILRWQNETIEREQVSLFVIPHAHSATVLTIQEGKEGDCWKRLREKLTDSHVERAADEDFLIYSLLDAIIDEIEPVLGNYTTKLEDIEIEMQADPFCSHNVNLARNVLKETLFIKRNVAPMTNAVEKLLYPIEYIGEDTQETTQAYYFSSLSRTYLRDILDRLLRILDNLETIKDHAQTIENQHETATEHRMNRTVYILTIISTIFLPLTFFAGVYGMNFRNFPELHWRFGMLYFWMVCLGTVAFILITFKAMKFI